MASANGPIGLASPPVAGNRPAPAVTAGGLAGVGSAWIVPGGSCSGRVMVIVATCTTAGMLLCWK